MIYDYSDVLEALTSPVRDIRGYSYIYNADGSGYRFIDYTNHLKDMTLERVGVDGKFFGFGVTTKAILTLTDKYRELNITTDMSTNILFGVGEYAYYFSPKLYITDVVRDENTNDITVTAYDAIYMNAGEHTIEELNLENYSMYELAHTIALNIGSNGVGARNWAGFNNTYVYANTANFSGRETLRDVLTMIAEATQTVYYLDYNDNLVFVRLDNNNRNCFTIGLSDYFTLKKGEKYTLTGLALSTELGDNIVINDGTGITQYMRNNPLLEIREDVYTLISYGVSDTVGLEFIEYDLEWRGLFNLEVGDRFTIIDKEGNELSAFLLNDVIKYDGGFKQHSQWKYLEDNSENVNNPTTLSDIVNDTYAKVDKINKQIELVTATAEDNTEKLAALIVNTDGISGTVSELQKGVESINGGLEDVLNKVDAVITPEEVEIAIKKEIDNGVNKVTTATGFTFNDDGLTVSKTNSEMKTTITEDGMIVYKNDDAVLTANNTGVDAVNLHATTYLIVGNNSRFEDYGTNRTGCFWIGG